MPALLTKTSTGPTSLSACFTPAAQASKSPTSHLNTGMPVSDLKRAASSLPAYEAATVKPFCFRAFEIAAPIPRLPPVTNATRAIVFPPPNDEANGSAANRPFLAFHAEGDAHAAADAQPREAL